MVDMAAWKKEFVKSVNVCINCQAQPFVYDRTIDVLLRKPSNGRELVSVLIYSSMPRSLVEITMCILLLMEIMK